MGYQVLEGMLKGVCWETDPGRASEYQAEGLELGYLSPGEPLEPGALLFLGVRKISCEAAGRGQPLGEGTVSR